MGRLDGKVVIVTGGAGGIGSTTSAMLAREGADVIVADINGAGASAVATQITAAGGRALGIEVNVANAASVQAMVAAAVSRFGQLDVLFANAGATRLVAQDVKVGELSQEVFDETMAVNARGTFLCCKYAIPAMLESGGGSIIATSSVASILGDDQGSAYGASKAAINQLMRAVATQYGKQGIRANTILAGLIVHDAPGLVPDEFREVVAQFRELMLQNALLPEHAVTESIGWTVIFLAADESRAITAAEIHVDSGLRAHAPQLAQMRSSAVHLF